MNKTIAALIAVIGGLSAISAYAQTPISLTNYNTYSQNFDSMTAVGVTAPAGWSSDRTANPGASGTATDAPVNTGTVVGSTSVVVADNGGNNAGTNAYNYGTAASTDRAYGSLASANNQRDLYVSFTNNTGAAITELGITYDGEQWRLGASPSAVNILTLQYSATGATGSWVNLGAAFNFTDPITSGTAGPLDGNAAANRVAGIGGLYTPPTPIANGTNFYLRWADPDDGGSDNGLAIDNVLITVPEPSTVIAGLMTALALLAGQYRRRRLIPATA